MTEWLIITRTFFIKLINKKSPLITLILFLSFLNTAQAANIVASLDRNQVFLDESFRLVFEADGSVDDDPDFGPLNRDFEILNQSQSTNMSFVNGQYSRKGVWSVELMAKTTGALTIPSIAFGKDQSPALRIQIKDPATTKKPSANKDEEVFIQVEVDEDKAWIQSQIIVTVRLFSRISMNNLRSSEAATSDPDAIIKQLDNATNYEAFREGVRYAVYETRYAIFPQHSGMLEFKPMIFEGLINRGRSQSFMDQFMNTGERKRVRSNSVSIEVQARPESIKQSDWLPARGITLSEEWSEDVSTLKNGEPVTRTITINAHGMMAENLPDLDMADIKELKQYPDKATLENKVTDKGISSSKQIKVALIPTRSGDFKLPAISVPWWNTKTGKQEVARLPEKLIRAHGEAANQTPTAPDKTTVQTETKKDETISPAAAAQIEQAGYWPWLSLLLGMGWLITLLVLLRKKSEAPLSRAQPEQSSLRALEKEIHQHSSNNDAQQTKDALLKWARARWPEHAINNLVDISKNVNPELATEMNILNAALYGANAAQWQGDVLNKNFKLFLQQKSKQKQTDITPLEPLYKS
jgi:hypothetical protein